MDHELDSADDETCDVCGNAAEYADCIGDGESLNWCEKHVPHVQRRGYERFQ